MLTDYRFLLPVPNRMAVATKAQPSHESLSIVSTQALDSMGGFDKVALTRKRFSSSDMSDWSKEQSPIACDMSVLSPAQRETHLATSRELFSKVQAIKELADGYEFQLSDEADVVLKVAEFVTLEKLCCPFLNFAIDIEADGGPVTLRLTGREGVKAFVREEINGLLGKVIDWDVIELKRGKENELKQGSQIEWREGGE